MRGRELFQWFKPFIALLTVLFSVLPRTVRKKFFIYHRKTNGKYGMAIRYALLKTLCEGLGDNVSIHPEVYIFNENHLKIGSNVSIHPMCYIDAVGGIDIGDDVSIAHRTSLISFNHQFDDMKKNIKDQPIRVAAISICNNVWIGANVCVLSGVEIASGCVIGAGTVLTKSTEENAIYAGVPGRRTALREKLIN